MDSRVLSGNPCLALAGAVGLVCTVLALAASAAPSGSAAALDLLPTPKQVELGKGHLVIAGADRKTLCTIVAGPEAGYAAELLAQRLAESRASANPSTGRVIRLRIDPALSLPGGLTSDARPEAYRLEVSDQGVDVAAVEPEGLLRGAATLLQLLRTEQGVTSLPIVTIVDWPDFRYRCASDWLLNVECNRWAYDWGDGRRACLARIKRKLDLCFAYKINQVWFDGFGWDIQRFPGYAEFVRQCSQYARQRGIRLTYAGYGGGYGTSYQASEIYRCGYFGQTFFNRRPYPDGEEYACRGMHRIEKSRRLGTCLANQALASAKIEEMKRFVAAVEPGFMYIHDIDTGTYAESQSSWQLRCAECRQRWPSDALADRQGQAGALAEWYGRIRQDLDTVSTQSGYRASRDLMLIFTSPLYTVYYEKGPPDLWQRETEYFCTLSRLLGSAANVQFGLREQFFAPDGSRKIASLRTAMDRCGGKAGIHVIAFGGGDHYLSDDLVNVSGLMVNFYRGAHSVCLSNGGVHEEPIQLLNAELLWAGSAAGYREEPSDERAAVALLRTMTQGRHRPAEIFAPGNLLERLCCRLWGDGAGKEMCQAYLTQGEAGEGPVSRVWWAVTADVARLKTPPAQFDWSQRQARWLGRQAASEKALVHARRAAALTDDEDVRWFATCLGVGTRFAECMAMSIQRRVRDEPALRQGLTAALAALDAEIAAAGRSERTDFLGGDPGCWRETLTLLRQLNDF